MYGFNERPFWYDIIFLITDLIQSMIIGIINYINEWYCDCTYKYIKVEENQSWTDTCLNPIKL